MILMHDKTYRKRLDEIKTLNILVDTLKNENETYNYNQKDLQDQIDYLMYCAKRKQERINKAIEYLEKSDDNENSCGDYDIEYHFKKELLDILKGSDKE